MLTKYMMTIAFASSLVGGEAVEDKKSIEGTWSVTYAVPEGKQASTEEVANAEAVISNEKVTFRQKGKTNKPGKQNVWRFQLDPSKKPKAIDVQLKKLNLRPGGEAYEIVSEKLLGIYELKDKVLKIALSKGIPIKKNEKDQIEADKMVTRPASFEHGPDVVSFLILKRIDK